MKSEVDYHSSEFCVYKAPHRALYHLHDSIMYLKFRVNITVMINGIVFLRALLVLLLFLISVSNAVHTQVDIFYCDARPLARLCILEDQVTGCGNYYIKVL